MQEWHPTGLKQQLGPSTEGVSAECISGRLFHVVCVWNSHCVKEAFSSFLNISYQLGDLLCSNESYCLHVMRGPRGIKLTMEMNGTFIRGEAWTIFKGNHVSLWITSVLPSWWTWEDSLSPFVCWTVLWSFLKYPISTESMCAHNVNVSSQRQVMSNELFVGQIKFWSIHFCRLALLRKYSFHWTKKNSVHGLEPACATPNFSTESASGMCA